MEREGLREPGQSSGQEIDYFSSWPGRCRPCKTIWYWPKGGSKYADDLAQQPQCPKCNHPLQRTAGSSKDQERQASREIVGLPIKSTTR